MLTYPSDSLHQIVCPMDEHAIPPNSFCSAPPHSEPPPPLLPFSSVTPSCAKNGISGHKRSDCIQEIQAQPPKKQSVTDNRAAQKPSRENLAPTKRQGESENMVSQSKQQTVEGTHAHEKQTEDGFDVSFAAECQNKPNDQGIPETEENVVEQFAVDATQNLVTTKSDMDTLDPGGGLSGGHSFETAPKGWVIGPLFQSFKSKMASFTEIVMSPVKLFRTNTPPPCMDLPDKLDESELLATETSDVEHSEPSHVFHSEAQSENENQERLSEVESAQNSKTVALKYSKILSFDVELPTHNSEQAEECAKIQKENNSPDSVPLQHIVSEEVSESVGSSILLQPSLNISASHETKLNMSGAIKDQKGNLSAQLKPLPRKCSVNRLGAKKVTAKTSSSKVKKVESEVCDEQFSHMNSVKSNKADSVCYAQPDLDCPQPDDGEDDGGKIESLDRPSHLKNLTDSANGGTLKPSSDAQLLDCQLNPETYSASGLGRAKRGVELDCHSQDFVKRKRLTADTCTEDTKKQELLNVASDIGIMRPPRREVVSTNPIVHKEETLKPVRRRPTVSTRANRKGKNEQEIIATINETVVITQTESYSLDKSSGVSENNLKGSSSKGKPSGSCKKLKTRTGLGKPDVNIDNVMELETSMAIASTEQAEQETLSEVLACAAIKPLQSSSKRRNINKKPVKRKSPSQSSSTTESESTLFSTSSALSMEPLDLTPTDANASQCVQKEDDSKKGLNQPSKRTKKGFRADDKSSASGGSQETKQCTHDLHLIAKENQPNESGGKISTDPVYFEMTPFESNQQPSSSQPNLNGSVQSNNEVEHVTAGKERSTAPVSEELFPTDVEASNHSSISVSGSSARRFNIRPRKSDKKKRKCRVLHSRTCKGEEGTKSITMDNADLATGSSHSRCLLRSYSCPEIPSLHLHDAHWTSALHSPHHSRIHTTHQSFHTPVHQAQNSLRRARRHTVCSVEVEREIAPLCLRKEVYPSRRSLPCDGATYLQGLSPSLSLSPSTSLSALASCFLSSPLAFLSKKVDSRGSTSPSTSSHVASACSPMYPTVFLKRIDSSSSTTLDYSSSGNLLACEMKRRQQSEEEDDGEDTSSSSHEFEDVGMREEKALSDSEIKVAQKNEERGKVSTIRIRKTLPKPQNNLTPMGLPRAVRLKKKEFSLEEIYTNKNFSKPPESRLETIFEVPLSRRDGSESWYGQRRVKRFLEFLDAGEVRKPKKPLVGVGKAGISSSRTRRGGFPKDEPALSVQDVDSLLCSKLEQLNLWLINDHKDS